MSNVQDPPKRELVAIGTTELRRTVSDVAAPVVASVMAPATYRWEMCGGECDRVAALRHHTTWRGVAEAACRAVTRCGTV